jgi:hypothetical protein
MEKIDLRRVVYDPAVNLSTADQTASVVGGVLAVVGAVIGVWSFVRRRRAAKAAREATEADEFVAELQKPTPEQITAKRLRKLNQRDYHGPFGPRRTSAKISLTPVVALVVVLVVVLVAIQVFLNR